MTRRTLTGATEKDRAAVPIPSASKWLMLPIVTPTPTISVVLIETHSGGTRRQLYGGSDGNRQRRILADSDVRPPAEPPVRSDCEQCPAPAATFRLHVKHHGPLDPHRCGHPGQQHGLRMPPLNLSIPTSMRRFLVASFFGDVTQQIHSFRATGVISIQIRLALALDSMATRKSAGNSCTVPPAAF